MRRPHADLEEKHELRDGTSAIAEKYITGTSMGTSVDYSCCSICHNKATVAAQYCDHIKGQKNKTISGKTKCCYHKSAGSPQDDCPICGKKVEESAKNIEFKDAKVHEWNYGLKFIENSFVVNQACHRCQVSDILNSAAVNKKMASIRKKIEKLHKAASCQEGCTLEKYAGQREITYLTEVMDKLEVVAKSMMAQKKYISMEYVSGLVEVLANLQAQTDELIEMGFVQVPSPDLEAVNSIEIPKTAEEAEKAWKPEESSLQPGMAQTLNSVPQIPPAGQPPVQTGPAGTSTEQLGNLGTVTQPKFSQIIEIKKKEFLKASSNLIDRLDSMHKECSLTESQSNQDNIKVETDKESIDMANEKTGTENDSLTKVADSPQAHSTDVIIEKQLNDAEFTGKRTDNPPSVIIEKRLDNESEAVNDTTSKSPQTRSGSYDTISEKQLNSVQSGYVVRWNDYPESITEKQWTDMSRLVGSVLSQDQDNRITEKQLADFTSKHRYVTPAVIQEKQLNDQTGDLSHYAYNADALVKSATQAISDAIAYYGKTPDEIKSAARKMNESVKSLDKAAMLTLVNALPHKAESRADDKGRYGYFSKLASTQASTPDTIDILIASMSDHLGDLSADDLIEAINRVAASSKSLEKIEELAKQKMASAPSSKSTDKIASLDHAISSLNKADDGVYRIEFEGGVGVSPEKTKKSAFVNRVFKCAATQIADTVGEKVNVALTNIDIDDNGDVIATVKDVNVLTAEEKEAWTKMAGDWDYMQGGDIDAALPAAGGQMAGMSYMKDEDEDEDEIDIDIDNIDSELDGVDGIEDEEIDDLEDEVVSGEENEDLDELGLNLSLNLDDLGLDDKEGLGDLGDEGDGEIQLDIEGDGLGLNVDADGDELDIDQDEDGLKVDLSSLLASSNKRAKIVKEAQMLGGEMGGQGGAAQTPGAGATVPQPPAGGEAPLESFEQSDLAGEFEGEEGDSQPKPPGSMCPVCGSEDVDIIKGQGKCNNCTSEMRYKIDIEVTKWAGLTGDKDDESIDGGLEGEGEFELPAVPEGGEGAPAAPAPAPAAPAPAMASSKKIIKTASIDEAKVNKFATVTVIKPAAAKKLAEMNIEIGSVSPMTGSTNTIKLASGKHVCLDTGTCYEIQYAVDAKDPKKIYAQFSWTPQEKTVECSECEQAHLTVVKALEERGIDEDVFDAMGAKEKGDLILSLKASGGLKVIKTASEQVSVLSNIKEAAADLSENFPIESCVERMARRYGEDAIALSGPCEGKKLADCVCKSLKKAGVYSNGLAVKVADIWKEKDASVECLEDFVREGYELKEAATICETMKAKYASVSDKFAQEINEMVEEDDDFDNEGIVEEGEEEMVQDFGDEDPFDDGEGDAVETDIVETDESIDDGIVEEGGDEVADAIVELVRALGKEDAVDSALSNGEEVEETVDVDVDVEGPEDPDGTDGPDGIGVEVSEDVEDAPVAPEEAAIEIEDETKPMEGSEGMGAEEEMAGGEMSDMSAPKEVAENLEDAGEGLEDAGEVLEEKTDDNDDDEDDKLEKIKEIINGKEGDSEEDANEVNDNPGVMNTEETDEEVEKEGEDMDKEAYTQDEAAIMRHGYVGQTDEINHLDFSKLASLTKSADTVKTKPAQDVVPFQYSSKAKIGDEDAFTADKPDVPNKGNASKMGDEQPVAGEKATVPTSDDRIGGEKDNADLKPELDDVATGGDLGQGSENPLKAANTQDAISRLAHSIMAQTKVERKFDQDDPDIAPISSGDGFIGDEKKSIGEVPAAKPAGEQDVPRAEAFIGNEKESIGEKPSEADMPSIPTKDDRIGGEKDNDKIAPEKENEMTGNVQQNLNAGSKARRKEATRIAGRMLQAGSIDVNQLDVKIAELERYEIEQLQDFEKSVLSSKKGLNVPVSGGIEQPVIIQAASNDPKPSNSGSELAESLTSLMSLARQNKMAQMDDDVQLRQAFKYGSR